MCFSDAMSNDIIKVHTEETGPRVSVNGAGLKKLGLYLGEEDHLQECDGEAAPDVAIMHVEENEKQKGQGENKDLANK